MPVLTKKYTLNDLRAARQSGSKVPMLTCYDYTTARHMQEAGVPVLLVGDSAANVILGYDSTVPVSLSFMVEITAAVRRGAPLCFVIADMPFGSYQASVESGCKAVFRMMKKSGCDCVKLEIAEGHVDLIARLADAGVAVMAHLGLRPQTVSLLGGYKYQGRTAREAQAIVDLARRAEVAGAAALLLEAVPPEVGQAVVEQTSVPVIGCGAGPACHGHVVVTQDVLGLSPHRPRFAPGIAELSGVLRGHLERYVHDITTGLYPAPEHLYEMPVEERRYFSR